MIKLEKVSFSYSEKQHTWALQDISLNIKKGKYYAVLGHNGSGKSTLSKIISGIYKPQKGKVFIDNIEMSSKTLPEIRKKIGIIFQNPDNQYVGPCQRYTKSVEFKRHFIPILITSRRSCN